MTTSLPEAPLPAKPVPAYPDDEISRRFTFHPAQPGQPELYEAIRAQAHELARLIIRVTPRSREHDIALTRLDETVFWANAAIARRTTPEEAAS